MHSEANQWIERLGLSPHPEGGFFSETYRSNLTIAQEQLGAGFSGPRASSTAIYYLLDDANFSAIHRISSDEMWHFYAGTPLRVEGLHPDGRRQDWILHNDPRVGRPQGIVPAQTWFGSRLVEPNGYALVGCTVSPGFDFSDFESKGIEPVIVEYLKEGLDSKTLTLLIRLLGVDAGSILRKKEDAYAASGLHETSTNAEIIAQIVAQPILLERPIVVQGERAAMGRPPENVLSILE
jgi:arsenate reductase (glutaredoxin)